MTNVSSHKRELPLDRAKALSGVIQKAIENAGVKVKVCGSIRRECEVVRDVDLVVGNVFKAEKALMQFAEKTNTRYNLLTNLENAKKVIDLIFGDVQVNMYSATRDEWGAMVLFLTGSAFFNIMLRAEAKRQDLKLSQYGLYEGKIRLAGGSEKWVFHMLDLKYIEPRYRSWVQGDSNHFERKRR